MSDPDSSREPEGSSIPSAEVAADLAESSDRDAGGEDRPADEPLAEPVSAEVAPAEAA